MAAGDSTDGRIVTLDLIVLEDDRRFFPPYQAVPLVRGPTLGRHRELARVLDRLAGTIDAASMRRLNHEVDGRHRDPAQVAREFLDTQGLLSPARRAPNSIKAHVVRMVGGHSQAAPSAEKIEKLGTANPAILPIWPHEPPINSSKNR